MRRADYGGADVLHAKTPLFQHRKAFMTPQEKELLTTLLDRVKNAPRQDKDPEADGLIRQAMAAQPDLPYYLTQTVLIQDLSLHQAQQRLADLEKRLGETVVNNYYGSDAGAAGGGGDWSSDAGAAGGGGDWSSDAGAAGGGYDPGSQDFSSDQDWGGGGGDWSSGDSNPSC